MARFHPRSSSRAASSALEAMPIRMITVSELGAIASRIGRYADSACPDTTANPDARPRCVTGIPASAGAAIAEVTPGTTSNGTPAALSAKASSAPRPRTNGSPHLSRTTRWPRRAARIMRWWIDSWRIALRRARLPTKNRCACGARSSAARDTRASNSTRSASAKRLTAFCVNRSGSPGPAPTSETNPIPFTDLTPLWARPRADRLVSRTGG